MNAPEPRWLTYRQARQQMQRIRAAEIPVEHAISLPVPTMRWGAPGFAHFAAPATRDPEGPTRQAPPDRWWVIDARRGSLLIYALMSAFPMATDRHFDSSEIHAREQDLERVRQLHSDLDTAMDGVLADFFASRPGEAVQRRRVVELLGLLIPTPLTTIYHALSPDFFAWLHL